MKLPSDAPRFVATVGPPYPDESLMGYLTRALSAATVDHLPTALQLADAVRPNPNALGTTLEDAEIDRLAHLIGCAPSDISARIYRTNYADLTRRRVLIDFFGTNIRLRYRGAALRRVSPKALQIAQYHRAVWELRVFSCDPDNKERLLDTCPVCQRPLGWLHALGPTVCDKCVDDDGLPTVDLRDFEQPLVEIPDEEAFDFVVGLVHPDPARKQAARKLLPAEYQNVSNSELFDAVIAMAFCLADRDARFRVNVKYLTGLTPDMLCAAARAIIDGQAGFDALCERLRIASGTRAGHHGRIKELGHLAGLSTSESPLDPQIRSIFREKIETNIEAAVESELNAAGEDLATLFRRRMASEFKMKPRRLHQLMDPGSPWLGWPQTTRKASELRTKPRRPPHAREPLLRDHEPLRSLPITRMAAEFGVRPERLRRLSRSGTVPVIRAESGGKIPVRMALIHVAPAIKELPDALRPHQVSIMIGAPIYAVRDLAQHGLIEQLDNSVASMLGTSAAYSMSSVRTLLEKLQAATYKSSSGERITQSATRIRTGTMPWAAIVKVALDGVSEIAVDPKLHAFKLRNLRVIDPISFTRAVRRHLMIDEPAVEEWIGPAEAAEVLKITYAFFWRLARSRPDLIPRRREGSAPYLLADIQSLAETYIFVSEIAFRRDLHPRLVVGWLRTMDVEAEFSVRKKQDLAFIRSQVEPVLDRWNMKDDAPARRAATEISASKPFTEHT